jgi:hypothetical protein
MHCRAAAAWLTVALTLLYVGDRAGACADAASCQSVQQDTAAPLEPPCPCESPELCQPIRHRHERDVRQNEHCQAAAAPPIHQYKIKQVSSLTQMYAPGVHAAQVFGFSVRQADQYAHYDWDQLTTVAWNTDPALMCMVRTSRDHPAL